MAETTRLGDFSETTKLVFFGAVALFDIAAFIVGLIYIPVITIFALILILGLGASVHDLLAGYPKNALGYAATTAGLLTVIVLLVRAL